MSPTKKQHGCQECRNSRLSSLEQLGKPESLRKKKVSATVLRFRHAVPPPVAMVSDVLALH